MNYQSTGIPPPPPPPSSRETDPILDILNSIRNITFAYNENIERHTRVIESYNENIRTILTLFSILLNRVSSSNSETNTWRNMFHSRNFRYNQPTRWNYLAQNDLSSLVYLLNIPLRQSLDRNRPARLTNEQITNGTRTIRYNDELGERRCPISLDDFTLNEEICQIRGCRHIFKTDHLMRWFESHIECPVCRYDLRQYREPNNSTSSESIRELQEHNDTQNETDNLEEEVAQSNNTNSYSIRRNISISEFLPILEEILDTNNTENMNRREHNTNDRSTPSFSTTTTNQLSNRVSQLISNIIMDENFTMDASNNLLYTIEIPLSW